MIEHRMVLFFAISFYSRRKEIECYPRFSIKDDLIKMTFTVVTKRTVVAT